MYPPGHRARPHLHPRGNVVDDADGFAVRVARQRVRDDVILHLPWGLCPCLHPIDGFAGGTLQAPILKEGKEGNIIVISKTLRKQGVGLGEFATATQL